MTPWPGQTDHLNAKSRGRLRLSIEAAETARARLLTVLLYNYTTALLTDTRLTQTPLHLNKSLVSLNLLGTDIYKKSESLVRFKASISPWGIPWEAPALAPNASNQSTWRTLRTSATASRCIRIHSICMTIALSLQDLEPTRQSN